MHMPGYWVVGLLFAVFGGMIVNPLLLWWLRRGITPPELPRERIKGWVTGGIERLFFAVLVGLGASGVTGAMIGWIAIKLASNWNHKNWEAFPGARAYAFSALLGGLVSMLFAYLGGAICAGNITIRI
jgi:hypothetical protein